MHSISVAYLLHSIYCTVSIEPVVPCLVGARV